MRVTKAFFAAGLVIALMLMWSERDFVLDAYQADARATTDLRLGGIDLTIEPSTIEPAPLTVLPAPDTRAIPTGLAMIDENPLPVPPPSIRGGSARLSGQATGPDGPVPFATVQLERHTSDGIASVDVTANSQGRWSISSLLGGRYRVRGWHRSGFVMNASHLLFVADGESRTADLVLSEVPVGAELDYRAPSRIYLGASGTITVSVTERTVDEDGIVVLSGVWGSNVSLTALGSAEIGSPSASTNQEGHARFTVRCDRLGPGVAVVRHGGEIRSFALPECVEPPPPPPTTTTTTPAPPPDPNQPEPTPGTTAPPTTPGGGNG